MNKKNNFYILTGGPGSGKTTIIEQLKEMGYFCVPEVGRKIIKEQISLSGKALPWLHPRNYSQLMLQLSICDYISHIQSMELHFFDRGIPDVLGYVDLMNLANKRPFIDAVRNFRYNLSVFVLPPWKEIYKTDPERKQDFKLATETYNHIKGVYEKYKYKLVELPFTSVSERIDFILNRIE
jgi:predicted ATPase